MQVLQEFYVKVSKKPPKSADQARLEVRNLMAWRPAVVDFAIVERSWKIIDRYQLSFWDALLWPLRNPWSTFLLTDAAAASVLDCDRGQRVATPRTFGCTRGMVRTPWHC